MRISAAAFNLVLPGTGFCLIGRYSMAMIVQSLLVGAVAMLCWSRLAFSPMGIAVFVGGIMFVHLSASVLGLTAKPRPNPAGLRYSSAFLFACAALAVTATVFVHKDRWLGVQIYFVPSMSMYPTLKPGQFILIDTWRYRSDAPREGEVVVFRQQNGEMDLVKRIATWPDGSPTIGGKLYVLGDYREHSLDSRVFGGVDQSQLVGQVKLVLAEIDAQTRGLQNEYLTPVH